MGGNREAKGETRRAQIIALCVTRRDDPVVAVIRLKGRRALGINRLDDIADRILDRLRHDLVGGINPPLALFLDRHTHTHRLSGILQKCHALSRMSPISNQFITSDSMQVNVS